MNINSLFKFQTIVAILVFALTLNVQAQTQTVATPPSAYDSCVARLTAAPSNKTEAQANTECTIHRETPSAGAAQCTADEAAYRTASATIGAVSPRTAESYLSCMDQEAQIGIQSFDEDESDIDEGEDDDASDTTRRCSALRSQGCAAINEFDPIKNQRDAQKDEQDAKKELQEARKALSDNIKENERKLVRLEQRIKEGQREYQLKLEKISKDLENQNKSADQALRKAISDSRAAITGKQGELSGLNDQIRAMELKVTAASTRWEASCRAEAVSKLEATKKEQKDEETAARAARERRNFAGSSLAGATNRRKAAKLREQQLDYNNAYKDCLAGTSAVGAAAKNAIEDARNELATGKVSMEEKRTLLAKTVEDLMKDLIDVQTASAENKDSLRKMAETAMKEATMAYTASEERAAIERSEIARDIQDINTYGNQAIELATTAANRAAGALQTADLRASCGTTVTSSQATRNQEKFTSVLAALTERDDLCATELGRGSTESCPRLRSRCATRGTTAPVGSGGGDAAE